ncbi:hypothetical protein [Mesoplasma melaleucae]|uniref:Uncharacterized protein n=1 Tax=Mesoplasma melaleucae TaxID=81459 RepID=A0A2K8NZH3_9MOLU|nr:hypothetical protein [Mesoplasma melaleucae]ATZ18131.1 hypothetical protein EMELA_v1c06200 [Mesoplasma melaleucae]
MAKVSKKTPLSVKIQTKNKFLIYLKFNFFSSRNSGFTLTLLSAAITLGVLGIITFLALESKVITTTEIYVEIIGVILLIFSWIATTTSINYNIKNNINWIFLFGGLKRNEIKNYALIYNLIVLVIQAIIMMLLTVIVFGIVSLASSTNLMRIVNLQFFSMLLLKVLSAYMLGLLISLVLGLFPKGIMRVLFLIAFFIVQYFLIGISTGYANIWLENNKAWLAWLMTMIPSVSSGAIIWWKVNHWFIFLGYLYNLIFIALLIWAWSVRNMKITY